MAESWWPVVREGPAARRLSVTTFHGLGLRLLREHHAEVGLHRGFRVADDATRLESVRLHFGLSQIDAKRRLLSRTMSAAGCFQPPFWERLSGSGWW